MNRKLSFTLIELIISMAILMAVTGIIAMASKSFYDCYDRSAKVTKRLKEYMAIDNIMDVHVRNMIPFQWNDDNGNYRFVFSGEEHKLHFTTLRRSYSKRAGSLIFIRLFVEENQLIAEYSTTPRLPWKEDGDEMMTYTREVIAENIEEITFTYAEKVSEYSYSVRKCKTVRAVAHEYQPAYQYKGKSVYMLKKRGKRLHFFE
jgi:hypothetical protein